VKFYHHDWSKYLEPQKNHEYLLGKACVAGAEDIAVDVKSRMALVGDVHIREGDLITIEVAQVIFI
jgi:hypothetical protein